MKRCLLICGFAIFAASFAAGIAGYKLGRQTEYERFTGVILRDFGTIAINGMQEQARDENVAGLKYNLDLIAERWPLNLSIDEFREELYSKLSFQSYHPERMVIGQEKNGTPTEAPGEY